MVVGIEASQQAYLTLAAAPSSPSRSIRHVALALVLGFAISPSS